MVLRVIPSRLWIGDIAGTKSHSSCSRNSSVHLKVTPSGTFVTCHGIPLAALAKVGGKKGGMIYPKWGAISARNLRHCTTLR